MRPDVGRAATGEDDPLLRFVNDTQGVPVTPRDAVMQQLVQWQPIAEATIQPSQIDYSVFAGFWDDSCGPTGIKNHRAKYLALLKAAVERDDSEQLKRLLKLPIRVPCCTIDIVDRTEFHFAPGTPTFDPFEKSGARALSEFTKSRRIVEEGTKDIRNPEDADGFIIVRTWPSCILFVCLLAIYAFLFGLLLSDARPGQETGGPIGTFNEACANCLWIAVWASAVVVGLAFTLGMSKCFLSSTSAPSCCSRRYRRRFFEFSHGVHRFLLRKFGTVCFWCVCSGEWSRKPPKMIEDNACSCGPECCDGCWMCNWDPTVCTLCCVSRVCLSMAPEVDQFIIRQELLEQPLTSETVVDGQSILDIAVQRRNPDVMGVLRPHGVVYLLEAADITARSTAALVPEVGTASPAQIRYTQGHLALNAAISVAAVFADTVYRALHQEVLHTHGHAISAGAPSLYVPPAPKPCTRDGHIPSVQPNCHKCRDRACCESQDAFAASFAALHPGGSQQMCWTNCDARKWATLGCHIEMAKAFCRTIGPHEKAANVSTFDKLDGTALFNMLSWCKAINSDYIGAGGVAQAAAQARNVLKHDDSLTLSERQYDAVFAGLNCFLERVSQEDNAEVAARARTALAQLSMLSHAHQMQLNMIHNRAVINVPIYEE
jgi:hypothetical protein